MANSKVISKGAQIPSLYLFMSVFVFKTKSHSVTLSCL